MNVVLFFEAFSMAFWISFSDSLSSAEVASSKSYRYFTEPAMAIRCFLHPIKALLSPMLVSKPGQIHYKLIGIGFSSSLIDGIAYIFVAIAILFLVSLKSWILQTKHDIEDRKSFSLTFNVVSVDSNLTGVTIKSI